MFGKGGVSLFSTWITSCFHTIYWKDYSLLPLNYFSTFVENQLMRYLGWLLDFPIFSTDVFILVQIPHCLEYHIITLETRWCEFSNSVYLFQNYFDYSKLSAFSYKFYNQLLISFKSPLMFDLGLLWIYRSICGKLTSWYRADPWTWFISAFI